MKNSLKAFLTVVLFFLQFTIFAQVPQRFSYQAVIRNSSNQLIINQQVGLKISILQGNESGNNIFSEVHTPTTNSNGLITIQVGAGTNITGSINIINWASGPYFIKSETDTDGGSNYTLTTTSQMMSVPYALYSENSGSSIPGPQGQQGPSGPIGLTGATGLQGPQGQAGPAGVSGTQGPIGLTGPTGPQGATGLTGTQGPQGPAGANGADGKTILNGTSNPTAVIGNNGDFFINTNTNTIFGPKAAGAWPTIGVSLVGPQGATGAQGPQGDLGPQGQQGPVGPQGSSGSIDLLGNSIPDSVISIYGNVSGLLNPTTVTAGTPLQPITVPDGKIYQIKYISLIKSGQVHNSSLNINNIPIWNGNTNLTTDVWLVSGDSITLSYGGWAGANGGYSDSWLISINVYNESSSQVLNYSGNVSGTLNPTTVIEGTPLQPITVPQGQVFIIKNVSLLQSGVPHNSSININNIPIWSGNTSISSDLWLTAGDVISLSYGGWVGSNGSYGDSWVISIHSIPTQ